MKLLIRILLVLLLLIVGVIGFLPSIVSLGGVRALVVEQANRSMPGSLQIDDWSLGWLRGIQLDGIRYRDPAGVELVTVAAIRTERSLLGLARDYQRIGRVAITEPRFKVPVGARPPAAAPAGRTERAGAPSEAAGEPRAEPTPAGAVALPQLEVEVVVEGGEVAVLDEGGAATQVLEDLAVEAAFRGAAEPARLSVRFRSGGGSVALDTEADFGGRAEVRPDTVSLQTKATIDAVQLDTLSRLVGLVAEAPEATGRLGGDFTLQGSLADGLRLAGTLRGEALRLRGARLQGDAPDLGDVALRVDGVVEMDRVRVSEFDLQSKLATATAQGAIGKTADGRLSAELTLDVAEALRQFPRTVGLQEGVALTSGTLNATATVTRSGEVSGIDASVVLSPLAGTKDGRGVAWDHPTELALEGAVGPDLLRVDRFALQSPFLTGHGSGDLEQAELTLEAEAGSALRELRALVDVGDWEATGRMQLLARVAAAGQGARSVSARLVGTQVSLRSGERDIIPAGSVTLQTQARLEGVGADGRPALRDAQARWNVWLSQGSLAAAEVRFPDAAGTLPEAVGIQLRHEGELAGLTSLLHALELAPATLSMAGRATVDATASLTGGRMDLKSGEAAISDLIVRRGDQEAREPAVKVSAEGSYAVDEGVASLASARLTFSSGTIDIDEAFFKPGADGADPTIRAVAEGEVDWSKLLPQLAEFVVLPEGLTVGGASRVTVRIQAGEDAAQTARLEARASGVTLRREEKALIRDEQLRLTAAASRDPGSGRIDVDTLDLQSEPVSVSATAWFAPAGNGGEVDLRGDLALDLEAVTRYLKAFTDVPLVMRGKNRQPFALTSRWTGDPNENILAATEGSAELAADRIEGFGLRIDSLRIPVSLANGVAQASIEAGVNQGRLAVHPVVDFNVPDPRLVLDQPTNVLSQVQVTPAVANELLGLVHPLFRGATGIQGTLNLGFRSFVWPLDPARQAEARFAGRLDFRDLVMSSSGLWYLLLEAAKINERQMVIGDRQVDLVCENGRIAASPIQINVEDTHLVISGSMGLDQTLDYVAQVPVTERLVGSEVFPYLEGTSIRVPITGTASRPDLGVQVLQKTLSDLAGQAIRKQLERKAGKLLESLFQ